MTIVGPDASVTRWEPPIAEVSCNEWVVGLRNGAWLVQASNPYAGRDDPIAMFEVTPATTVQLNLPPTVVTQLTP